MGLAKIASGTFIAHGVRSLSLLLKDSCDVFDLPTSHMQWIASMCVTPHAAEITVANKQSSLVNSRILIY